MCVGLAAAAGGAQGLGLIMQTQGVYQQAVGDKTAMQTQAAVARNTAQVQDWQASDALVRGQQGQFQEGLKTAQVLGAQRARMAAGGSSLDEGSPLNVLADTKYMGDMDFKTIGDNAAREAWALRTSAANSRTNADLFSYRADMINPRRQAATTFLSGAGKVAQSWYMGGGAS